jgi:protocatechuate 3,4-dioxygenase, alpha subunit
MTLPETPSQTVGPFFAIGLSWERGHLVVPIGTEGAVVLAGQIYDGEGTPMPDALVETWQVDDHFSGFGRSGTDADGRWAVLTRKPEPQGGQAPHVALTIHARGLLRHVHTRLYFADEPERNAADPVLNALDAEARATLIARPADDGYVLDINMQGPHATAFLRF